MKKFIALLVAVCIVFTVAVSMPAIKDKLNKANEPNIDDASIEVADAAVVVVDYDSIYTLHEPKEIVANVGGRDIEWQEYFYWLCYNMIQVENYMDTMKMNYGLFVNWTDEFSEGMTYLDYALDLTEDNLCQIRSLEVLYENSGVDLSEKMDDYLKETYETDKTTYCGENASDEEFVDFLAKQHTALSVYNRINTMGFYLNELKNVFYGENCELVTDEQAAQALEDNGYIYYANHIFFKSEEDDDEVLAKAQAVTDELRAIEDTDELLARFAELKEELDEDSGKTVYPDGYIFKTGQMVPAFEEKAGVLENYEISDPVKSEYGYHVMMGLSMNYDVPVSGAGVSGRMLFASDDYNKRITESYEGLEVVYADSFGEMNLMNYIK